MVKILFTYTTIFQAIEDDLLAFPNIWIVFGDYKLFEKLNYYIPMNSVFILPKFNAYIDKWELVSFYKINKYLKDYMENVYGTWSLQDGLNISGRIILTRNRSDFMGMPLRVSYVINHPSSFDHMYDYR